MKLFDINQQILNCVVEDGHAVDTETGEVIDMDALDQLKMDAAEKTENIAMWIRDLDAEEKALAEQEKIFADRKRAAKNKKESLKQYLAMCLAGKKFKTDRVAVSFRKTEAVKVVSEKEIPAEFLIPVDPKVDKTGIKKAIKAGQLIPGVELEQRQSIIVK